MSAPSWSATSPCHHGRCHGRSACSSSSPAPATSSTPSASSSSPATTARHRRSSWPRPSSPRSGSPVAPHQGSPTRPPRRTRHRNRPVDPRRRSPHGRGAVMTSATDTHTARPEASTTDEDTTMKAITRDRFGSTDVLSFADVSRPHIPTGDVLVDVHAAGVNRGDALEIRGWPYLARLMGQGVRHPKHPVLGTDIAGTVVAVSTSVQEIDVGDEIVGFGTGAFAELAIVPPRLRSTGPTRSAPKKLRPCRPPPSPCSRRSGRRTRRGRTARGRDRRIRASAPSPCRSHRRTERK